MNQIDVLSTSLASHAEKRLRHGGFLREVCFGPFVLSRPARLLTRNRDPVQLGSRAFILLSTLVSRAGDVVSKAELMACAWPDTIVDEGNLRFQISQLRRALGDGKDGARYIKNIPGRGYCLVVPVYSVALAMGGP
jgi:DNA-binding winged helix-turn-helix (wHTH) protein